MGSSKNKHNESVESRYKYPPLPTLAAANVSLIRASCHRHYIAIRLTFEREIGDVIGASQPKEMNTFDIPLMPHFDVKPSRMYPDAR